MNYFHARLFTATVALLPFAFFAQATESQNTVNNAYIQLLEATRFISNYKQVASISAKVFAARGQGNDREYASLMAKIAVSDLSDIKVCFAGAYSGNALTVEDAQDLVEIFKSPIGSKILDLSQNMLIANIERAAHQSPSPVVLTDIDRKQMIAIYKRPSFTHYGTMLSSPSFGANVKTCLMGSRVVRESGIKF